MNLESFGNPQDAEAVAQLLEENKIEYNVIDDANSSGDPLGLDFQNRGASTVILQVQVKDIDAARLLLETSMKAGEDPAVVEGGEYLESFNDEELLEILKKPDEWNQVDFALALKLLKDRGKEYSEEDLKRFYEERLETLKKPLAVKGASFALASVGALFAIFCGVMNFARIADAKYLYVLMFAFLVACLSFISGWNWTFRRKRLPSGEKIFVYEEGLRRRSRFVLAFSIVALLLIVADVVVRTMGKF